MSVTRVGELRLRRAAARSTASGWLLRHRLLHGLRGEGGSGEVVSGQGEGGGGGEGEGAGGHPGRLSWGLSIRGAGRGHLLVRAVAHGGGDVEPSMTKWALTVAKAVRLSPQAFHEPTCVGDVFTSRLVRLVL